MSKRKRGASLEPHRDKYQTKPRAAAPVAVAVESEPIRRESTTRYKCTECKYIGTADGMDDHRRAKRHYGQVPHEEPTVTPDEIPDLPARKYYRCLGCDFYGTGSRMKKHLRFHQRHHTYADHSRYVEEPLGGSNA